MAEQDNVTLSDVAEHAGVSLATASRALNGGTRVVREDLRLRVLASAGQLRYTPNAHAQALARATSTTVGLIVHDISDAYFSAIAGGVIRVATERGMLVMTMATFRDPSQEVAYVGALRSQQARAILLAGSGFEGRNYRRALRAEADPYLQAGGRMACITPHGIAVDTVAPDNYGGAAELGSSWGWVTGSSP